MPEGYDYERLLPRGASHACDAIEDAIGMEHGGEPSAYLIGWIASCINKARLGIGDFVELKEDKEK